MHFHSGRFQLSSQLVTEQADKNKKLEKRKFKHHEITSMIYWTYRTPYILYLEKNTLPSQAHVGHLQKLIMYWFINQISVNFKELESDRPGSLATLN